MFAVFLPAINFRGNRSPYLWWFHKLLYELGDQAAYICGDDYFRDPAELLAEGRSEASDNLQYSLPDRATLIKQIREDVPLHVWQALEARYPANPLAAFKHYCQEFDAPLESAIKIAFDQLYTFTGSIEAVITCVNCFTLQEVCRNRNLPLIHIELGPLRQPVFLQPAYFDFSGVNGNTESHSRFNSLHEDIADDWCSLPALRKLFFMELRQNLSEPDIELGLCLQVEDDSNILCYANGYSSLSIIHNASNLLRDRFIRPPVLVRSHPSSQFALQRLPPGLEIDKSATSVDFVSRCQRIHAINSGLLVEALLQNRAVNSYGDSPFSYCISSSSGSCNETGLSFFLLNYLVPWRLAFAPDYIRWRLGGPTESEIRKMHLENLMLDKIDKLQSRVEERDEYIASLEMELNRIKSTASWQITKPLRFLAFLWRSLVNAIRSPASLR